jgi:hypothetical protein
LKIDLAVASEKRERLPGLVVELDSLARHMPVPAG